MNLDPYQVLGVPHDASDEDVSKAYKKLAKQYHPDLNPGNQEAARKMSEVNAAYDLIKSGQANPAYGNAHGTASPYRQSHSGQTRTYTYRYASSDGRTSQADPFEGFDPFEWIFGAYARQRQSYSFEAAANHINMGNYEQALNVLNHLADRSAQWHFYSAIANYGLGYRDVAREHARMAVEMEPDNAEYQNLLSQMSGRRSWFGSTSRRTSSFSPLGTIVKLFIGFYAIQFLLSFLGLIF
ncbi:DnaJ domain-containing protein [Acetobacterium wieringae]|uniref:DnaJ domain-containing protein n=1 Tax=Acetobacterium wieringae TaxID=52694 RepID=A0A5D0WU97_9FIRM|nr:DnaJ domain-containing protein [Acetobacterium wieringae]TYC87633.1 DnaJ domain-containing protein [Acetobacterium wieringae]